MSNVSDRAGDPGLSDEQLVERVVAGETELFERIMRRNNQRLYRALRAILRNEQEVEDVLQETYLRAFQHLASFENRAQLSTWLVRIAVHEAFARLRRAARQMPLDPDRLEESEATDEHPETQAFQTELRQHLERAVDELPAAFRTVFVLRQVEGMSVAETAACLEIPTETVKTRLFRARRLLQEQLMSEWDIASKAMFHFAGAQCDRVVASVMARLPQLRLH